MIRRINGPDSEPASGAEVYMMRERKPDWNEYGISRQRYNELRAYCLQYPEWISEASSLAGVGAQQYGEHIRGSEHTSVVVRAAERREELLDKINLIEGLASAVEGGRWYAALIQNCCMGKPLSCIDPTILPTSFRNPFYIARRKFFILLNTKKI